MKLTDKERTVIREFATLLSLPFGDSHARALYRIEVAAHESTDRIRMWERQHYLRCLASRYQRRFQIEQRSIANA
jgi:hypothetical protein